MVQVIISIFCVIGGQKLTHDRVKFYFCLTSDCKDNFAKSSRMNILQNRLFFWVFLRQRDFLDEVEAVRMLE